MIMQQRPEIEINGVQYRVGPMDTFVQFHVARRLGPVLMEFTDALANTDAAKLSAEQWIARVFGPVMGVVSRMSDADAEYILRACLATVERKDGDRWALVQRNGNLMYSDVLMDTMLKLTIFVVRETLGPFLPEALAATGSGSSLPTA